jgi:hypothetical protein
MSCFEMCFKKKKEIKIIQRQSIDDRTMIHEKSRIIKHQPMRKVDSEIQSPFRKRVKDSFDHSEFKLETNQSPDLQTINQDKSRIITELEIQNRETREKENNKHNNVEKGDSITSKLKRAMTKQRFSIMNTKIFEVFNKGNANQTKQSSSNSKHKHHWVKKDKLRCLFCGGTKCKHENYQTCKNPAIIGLHSNYITEDIIASQRPSTILVQKYKLIKTFKEQNIGMIVNVQREGEHPYCGPNTKLEESGFTYNPNTFIADDIKCRHSGWKDMSVPESMTFVLEIVKDMMKTVKEESKKVLVHCHAGYGRTGVVIACYMIFDDRHNSPTEHIVQRIREKRPGCVQKREQFVFCDKFREYVNKARILFPPVGENNNPISKKPIEFFMKNQSDTLYGEELKKYHHIPKLISKAFDKIFEIKRIFNIDSNLVYQSLCVFESWDEEHEQVLNQLKKSLNKGHWEMFNETENIVIISQLLYDWLEDCVEYIISPEHLKKIMKDSHLCSNISMNIEESYFNGNANKEGRQLLFELIKKSLRLVEYETIFKVSYFCAIIYPEKEEDKISFLHMVDRISLHLLGYKYADVYLNANESETKNIVREVCSLSDIIRLFIIGIRLDHMESGSSYNVSGSINKKRNIDDSSYSKSISKSNTVLTNNNNIQTLLNSSFKSRNNNPGMLVEGNNPMIQNYNSSHTSKNKLTRPSFFYSNTLKSENDSESYYTSKKGVKNLSSFEQEKFFYNMYEKLDAYFASQSGGKKARKPRGSDHSIITNGENISAIHMQPVDKRGYNSTTSMASIYSKKKNNLKPNNAMNLLYSESEDGFELMEHFMKNFYVDQMHPSGGKQTPKREPMFRNDLARKSRKFSMIYQPDNPVIKEELDNHLNDSMSKLHISKKNFEDEIKYLKKETRGSQPRTEGELSPSRRFLASNTGGSQIKSSIFSTEKQIDLENLRKSSQIANNLNIIKKDSTMCSPNSKTVTEKEFLNIELLLNKVPSSNRPDSKEDPFSHPNQIPSFNSSNYAESIANQRQNNKLEAKTPMHSLNKKYVISLNPVLDDNNGYISERGMGVVTARHKPKTSFKSANIQVQTSKGFKEKEEENGGFGINLDLKSEKR